jgi:hypothetical protein
MATIDGALIPLARTSGTLLRRAFSGRRAVRLLTARVIVPCLSAIERFLDAKAQDFSQSGWI